MAKVVPIKASRELPEIEKGIPMPPKRGGGIASVLAQMEVGDSVLWTNKSSVATLAKYLGGGRKFSQRTMPDGTLRVWRIA